MNTVPAWTRAHWKPLVGAGGALLVVSIILLTYALHASPKAESGTPVVETLVDVPTVNRSERALDGVLVDASSTHLLPLGVMVENSTDAWPLQGPAKAQLVFEAPVEGSITRFFLVFDASSTVAEIGPVRSARPYYVDFADALHAQYAHVGGSPDALTRIAAYDGFQDLNEFYNGWAFWRSQARAAPHNVYTRPELLLRAAERKSYVPGSFKPWTYADIATSTTSTVALTTKIHVPYLGAYAADWTYDAATGLYTRHHVNGSTVRDADGTPVTATNVVLILTDSAVLDDVGRLSVRTTGSGKALVFTRGGMRQAEWERASGEYLHFSGVDGSEVAFARGTTWISVVTDVSAFGKVVPE